MHPHKVLVTGAAGYVGAMLVRELLASGYAVVAVDSRQACPQQRCDWCEHRQLTRLQVDVRHLAARDFAGVAAVVDLSAIAGVKAAARDPVLTDAVNHLARVRLAELAAGAGVARHVLVSSGAVYGNTDGGVVTEASAPAPQSTYAHSSLLAETGVLAHRSRQFCPVVLRPGTAYGLSASMRTDLMLHQMTSSAVAQRKIVLQGGGQQWRPLVHVRDLVRAIMAALRVAPGRVHGEIFNIAHSNLRVAAVAEIVREMVGTDVTILTDGSAPDPTNYGLDSTKARQRLGWRHYESIRTGIYELARKNGP